MRVAIFSATGYERSFLDAANARHGHELIYFEPALRRNTARLAAGFPAVCGFVHDDFSAGVMLELQRQKTRLIALRCAGFNNVDVEAAEQLGMTVLRVPAYSPAAVAEHTVALLLALNRKIHRAYLRVREGNFALDGLLGFELAGKTVGIIGTGKIGLGVGRILVGFGCTLLGYDPHPGAAFTAAGGRYVPLDDLFAQADILSLHLPLTPDTRHLIDAEALGRMKRGVVLLNTSRGELLDTRAVIAALKSGKVGLLGLDVYEEETNLFFRNLSDTVIQDDVFARLLTFPNVLITSHQAFFTEEALSRIAETTMENLTQFEEGNIVAENEVRASQHFHG
ncbi:MAG: 2-hydroxyacid dehydrogenase [Phycisphaerales bacterium]|nr:2-hydroxyacid dehydrogenase [Phycisphaerales bacterium]